MKFIVTVRGMLKGDAAEARMMHDDLVGRISPMGRSMGNTSHQTYINVQNGKEFFAIDVWGNMEAIQKLYSDPNLAVEFGKLFEGQPDISVWAESGWLHY